MYKLIIYILINLIIIKFTLSQSQLCVTQDTCGKCLSIDVSCSWCTDREYDMWKPRCMTKADLLREKCRSEYIFNNKWTPVELVENTQMHDFTKGSLDAVQIQPQSVKLKLRKSETKTIKVKYRPAKNYPLDLYYLMDLTWSMIDDKETLVRVANDLANTLNNLTENYRMGFGSFADKPTLPYILLGDKAIENPCATNNIVCEKTYGYRHKLKLTKDTENFIRNVNSSDATGNLDNLEGGLDAIMQILVCNEKIGWTEQSRKMILFASDGLMHFAGDGKLAGITRRAERICYLDDDGVYEKTLEQDYPSLEQIYRELSKKKVNIVFAVTQDVVHIYDQIHGLMEDISSVGILKMDSSNILQLIDIGYKDFVKRVNFFDDAPSNVAITYETKCGDLYEYYRTVSRCDNIEIGKEYEFLVNVTLLDYPDDGVERQNFKIEESGISSEFVNVEIEMEDECTCLAKEEGQLNSSACNLQGELKCGMCFCNEGWIGKTCGCNLMNYESSRELDNLCRLPAINFKSTVDNLKLGSICSDHGECICGSCHCNVGFTGHFCECYPCPYVKDEICGGEERAFCDCGTCVCKDGWSGEKCDCKTSNVTCIPPNEEKICSGHGLCECGECKCLPNYRGDFCESNSTIGGDNALCSYYEECVKCDIERKQNMECINIQELCKARDGTEITREYYSELEVDRVHCMVRLKGENGDLCDHYFTYDIDENLRNHIRIQNTNCGAKVDYANIGFGVLFTILATFLLGCLFLAIFKVHQIVQEKREFAQFESEQVGMTNYNNVSPIYNSPIREYQLPNTFRQENTDSIGSFTEVENNTRNRNKS